MINFCKQNCKNDTRFVDCVTASGTYKGCKYGLNAVNTHCKVISHRGHSHKAPENTLASVAESIAVGADVCEFDVRTTADGHVVLMHDATVDRTTNGSGAIAEMTLADAQLLDAGAWKSPDYIGRPVPSLDEVFQLMAPAAQSALVELKSPSAAEGTIAAARKYSMLHRTIALSEEPAVLKRIQAIEPNITRALLCTAFPQNVKGILSRTDWLIAQARKASAEIVDIDYRFTSPRMIAALHHAGLKVWVWTVNSPQIMNCLIDWNIDAIASDKPDTLKAILNTVRQNA